MTGSHRPNLLPISSTAPPDRQSGAVLVIGLLVMLIMMVIGVTAVGTSTKEERMAANTQNATVAFQAAETAIGGAVGDAASMVSSMSGTPVTQAFTTAAGVTSNSTLSYGGTTAVSGFSMGSSVAGHLFDINQGTVLLLQRVDRSNFGRIEPCQLQRPAVHDIPDRADRIARNADLESR